MQTARYLVVISLLVILSSLTGCYQMHSDDDLRTIPATNNPTIVPQNQSRFPGTGM